MAIMTPIAYRGFRPTSRYIGFVWRGHCIIGVEIAPDAFGFVIMGFWMGWVKE